MRSLDYMNRVEAYVNRLNSERRTVLETIPQVRFLDLMADEFDSLEAQLKSDMDNAGLTDIIEGRAALYDEEMAAAE